MIRQAVLPLLLLLALAAPASAANTPKPRIVLGEADGVTLQTRGGVQFLRFPGTRAFRPLANRPLDIECTSLERFLNRLLTGRGVSTTKRLPRRGGRVRLGRAGRRPFAICRVERHDRLVAITGATDLARTHIDELTAAGRLIRTEFAASPGIDLDPKTDLTKPVPAETVVERGQGTIVALPGPDDTPPPGKAGYWTDGVSRVVSTATTSAGRRLYADGYLDRDDVSLNVLGLIGERGDSDSAIALAESADRVRYPF